MWNWSDAALLNLAGGHTVAMRVDVLHGGEPSGVTLIPTGGTVHANSSNPVRWNLGCTLVDPTGELSRGDVEDLLDPYECEIQPWRGVMVAGVPELAPLGVYALTSRSVDDSPDGLVIGLSGQDRSITYQGPMSGALPISAGTPVEVAIEALLSKRNQRLTLQAMVSGFTVGPLVFEPDIDVWKAAQELAESVGGRLFHDRTGQCVFALAGPASDSPVAVYEEGDGRLLSVSRQEDSDTIRNVVRVQNTSGSIYYEAADLDTTSPTYANGRYGRRVFVLVNQHIHTQTQAIQAATTRLAYELGRSETGRATVTVDAGRDVDEVISMHRPRAGLDRRAVVIGSLDIPLSATDSMDIGFRQSRLAPDGEVLEEI